jgi:hypothetical protein
MCDVGDEVGISAAASAGSEGTSGPGLQSLDISKLQPHAHALAGWRENRESHVGFVGYGNTRRGNKVLIAVDREYDPIVPEAIAQALKEKGAHVDLLFIDMGEPDREFDFLDEVRVIMRREPWEKNRGDGRDCRLSRTLPLDADMICSFTARGGLSLKQHTAMSKFPGFEPIISCSAQRLTPWTFTSSSTKKLGIRSGRKGAAAEPD